MQDAPFEIAEDASGRYVRATVQGFWTVEIVERYAAELSSAIARLRQTGRRAGVVVDAGTMQPQAPEIGRRFVESWTTLLDQPEDRAAIVVTSALATMQFRRIYETDRCHIFSSSAAAEAWLLAQLGGAG